jgi:hypothetical protein
MAASEARHGRSGLGLPARDRKRRETLARNFALRNPDLGTRELNFAVQRTIDRLIFLRMCEDRGIELYQQLQTPLHSENLVAA